MLVYDELRSLARSRLSKVPPGNTLQPTALVHEAYARLVRSHPGSWNGRGHFFASAAEAMRQILVEQARRKSRIKRGGDRDRVHIDADAIEINAGMSPEDFVMINEALMQIEHQDAELAMIIKLRFFAGLSPQEIAVLLDVSQRTVERRWRYAAAVLRQSLSEHAERADVDHA